MPCPAVEYSSVFAQTGDSVRFARRQVLWKEGDPADGLFIVCAGAVKNVQSLGNEREVIWNVATKGEVLGEESATSGMRRSLTCQAISKVRGFWVDTRYARALLRRQPDLMQFLLQTSCERADLLVQRHDELTRGNVESRVARVFLRLTAKLGLPDARGFFLPLKLNRAELASMVGCREETVIRVMTRWQRAGWLQTCPEGFVISDADAIRRASVDTTAGKDDKRASPTSVLRLG